MLTSFSFLQPGQPWPPRGEASRLQTYEDNKNLFESKHELVFKDWNRILREDQQASLLIVLAWHERLSTLWADLLLGEPPAISAGEADTPEQETCNRLVADNDLINTAYEAVIDTSRFGDGIFKIRFDKRGIIEAQPPSCWFPVVDPTNIKQVLAHVLAWTWTEDKTTWTGANTVMKYLQVEIHERGKIITRRYLVDGGNIGKQVAIEGVQEEVLTGVDDFLVRPFHNLITSDRYYGIDDYSKIDSIIQELEMRMSQISRILDKHSDPNMYGPESALTYDPDTHQYGFKAGGKYFPCEAGDQTPGYLTWDGQLIAAYTEFDKLLEQLYILTETCPAAFGQTQSGQAESGTSIKLRLMAPLAKTNRIRMRLDPALKDAIRIASELEAARGMPGAVKLEQIHIEWKDGIPDDPKESHAIENEDYVAGTASLESILKNRGLSGDMLQEELDAIKGASNIDLGAGGE